MHTSVGLELGGWRRWLQDSGPKKPAEPDHLAIQLSVIPSSQRGTLPTAFGRRGLSLLDPQG